MIEEEKLVYSGEAEIIEFQDEDNSKHEARSITNKMKIVEKKAGKIMNNSRKEKDYFDKTWVSEYSWGSMPKSKTSLCST